MNITWIKPLDGIGGQEVVAAPSRAEKRMREMITDIGGSNDWLAIYVTTKSRHKHLQGSVAAFVQVQAVDPDVDLRQFVPGFNWNIPEQWGVACPVRQPWKGIPKDLLLEADNLIRQALGEPDWLKLRHSFRSGAPRPIGHGRYAPVGKALTAFTDSHRGQLVDLPDLGHDSVNPGSPRRRGTR